MGNILSSLIVAVVTSILSIIGTLIIQKRKNANSTKKNALYLYLNLKQTKSDIDREKKVIDGTSWDEILPMNYFTTYDYIGVLSELKDKLSEQEMMDVNNFYESVKKVDNKKMNFISWYNLYSNFSKDNPLQTFNPYCQQYVEAQNAFRYALNVFVNSDAYKDNIVKIITKLHKMKE